MISEKPDKETMIRALFICTQNKLRSPTAEQVFATYPEVETDSAGLGNDANVQLSTEQIAWASVIFVMESCHKQKLQQKFRAQLNGKRIICLNIRDEYDFMQEELVQILIKKVTPYLLR